MMRVSVIEHLESNLGTIEGGWSEDWEGAPVEFQVVEFSSEQFPDCVVLSTLGLSDYEFRSRVSEKLIRHELTLVVRDVEGARGLVGVLQQVGKGLLSSGSALLRGDFIAPRAPLILGSQLEGFYVSLPSFLPDDFAVCDCGDRRIVFAWLIPISRDEAHFISTEGWEAFEDILCKVDVDLFSLEREGVL